MKRIKVKSLNCLELRDIEGHIHAAIMHEQYEMKRTGRLIDIDYVVKACLLELSMLTKELYNFEIYTKFVNLGTEDMPCWLYNNEKEEMQWNDLESFNKSKLLLLKRIIIISKFLEKNKVGM